MHDLLQHGGEALLIEEVVQPGRLRDHRELRVALDLRKVGGGEVAAVGLEERPHRFGLGMGQCAAHGHDRVAHEDPFEVGDDAFAVLHTVVHLLDLQDGADLVAGGPDAAPEEEAAERGQRLTAGIAVGGDRVGGVMHGRYPGTRISIEGQHGLP